MTPRGLPPELDEITTRRENVRQEVCLTRPPCLIRVAAACCLAIVAVGTAAGTVTETVVAVIHQHPRTVTARPRQTSDAQGVLEAVNTQRRERGLVALVLDERLTQAAAAHARDLVRRGTLGHRGSDGSTLGQRVTRAGYNWSTVAENLALTTAASPRGVVALWMKSRGHRKNLLNREVTQMGLAHIRTIWVLVLARPARRLR